MTRGERIYFYDESGKRYIDGPVVQWLWRLIMIAEGFSKKKIDQMGRVVYVKKIQFKTESIEEYLSF